MKGTKVRYSKFIELLVLLYPFTIFSLQFEKIYLYVVIPFLTIYTITNIQNVFSNKLFKVFFVFVISLFLTGLYAKDMQKYFIVARALFGILMYIYFSCALLQDNRYIKTFIILFFLYYILIWIKGFTEFNFASSDITSERVSGEGLNSNRFGYFTFFITFMIFILGELPKTHKFHRTFKRLFFFTPFISIFNALITASRQVLIIMIPFIVILLLMRYYSRLNTQTVVVSLLLVTACFLVAPKILVLIDNSYLKVRLEMNLEDDARTILFVEGFREGTNNYCFGNGLGHREFLTHSSYPEAFSEGGFPSFILFVYMLIIFCKTQIKRYRMTKNKFFLYIFIFGIFYMADNLFFVFYKFNLLILMLFLIQAISDSLYNNKILQINAIQ